MVLYKANERWFEWQESERYRGHLREHGLETYWGWVGPILYTDKNALSSLEATVKAKTPNYLNSASGLRVRVFALFFIKMASMVFRNPNSKRIVPFTSRIFCGSFSISDTLYRNDIPSAPTAVMPFWRSMGTFTRTYVNSLIYSFNAFAYYTFQVCGLVVRVELFASFDNAITRNDLRLKEPKHEKKEI